MSGCPAEEEDAGRVAQEQRGVKTALSMGEQVASAMGKAHENSIVHRDLKPDNIFLLNADASASAAPTVKVLDFGIAKVPATPTGGVDTQVLTLGGTFLGTLAYMPPEQSSPRAWG